LRGGISVGLLRDDLGPSFFARCHSFLLDGVVVAAGLLLGLSLAPDPAPAGFDAPVKEKDDQP